MVSAAIAPASLLVAAAIARQLHGRPYDPVAQTLSVLASNGSGSLAMTIGFVVTACCHLITATGLRVLRAAPRIALGLAGVCGLGVAVFRQPATGATALHLWSVALGLGIFTVWPLLTLTRGAVEPITSRPLIALAATALLTVLLAWLLFETQGGTMLGLAERICVVTQTLWPLTVAAVARRRQGAGIA